jgi:hypothetical protein
MVSMIRAIRWCKAVPPINKVSQKTVFCIAPSWNLKSKNKVSNLVRQKSATCGFYLSTLGVRDYELQLLTSDERKNSDTARREIHFQIL